MLILVVLLVVVSPGLPAGPNATNDVSLEPPQQVMTVGVAASDPDVVEPAVVAQGEVAVGVDGVVTDAVLSVVDGDAGRDGFGSSEVGLLWCEAVEGSVGTDLVVVAAEVVELVL